MVYSGESEKTAGYMLHAPGLRLIKDPSIVIPALAPYPNQDPALPIYRDASGEPTDGWAVKVIATRRFSSQQSARIYYRASDLEQSTFFAHPSPAGNLRIWPISTVLVLETFSGNSAMEKGALPVEMVIMAKTGRFEDTSGSFYPVNWSYAKFSPSGEQTPASNAVNECHQCHRIAFHITGDLIFTQFP